MVAAVGVEAANSAAVKGELSDCRDALTKCASMRSNASVTNRENVSSAKFRRAISAHVEHERRP